VLAQSFGSCVSAVFCMPTTMKNLMKMRNKESNQARIPNSKTIMAGRTPTNSGNDFDIYYHEFALLLRQLGATGQPRSDGKVDKHPSPTSQERLHQQCSELLSLMALEARSAECPDAKFERLERVKIYKFQLEAVRQKHNKDFLMGDQASSMLQVKDRLTQSETRAAQQNELLERARRSVLETEQVGASIMEEIGRNRETIQSAQGRIGTVSSLTGQASKIVKNMSRPWWMRR
jgi:vesicle transport through interaction with t-SNAREs 1